MTDLYNSYDEPVDMLKLYFAKEWKINDDILIKIPTVGDIIEFEGGDTSFYSMIYIFCGNTTHFRVMLWNLGIDWNKLTDMELFAMMIKGLTPNQSGVLFKDLDFTKFEYIKQKKEGELVEGESKYTETLYDPINNIEISMMTYLKIRNVLRYMFNIFPKVEVGIKKKRLKEEIIRYDIMVAEKAQRESKGGSYFFPLISSCLNHPGFKYKKDELKNVSIVEFMDSVQRLSTYEQSIATLRGMMSGFVDSSKIKPEQYNFMKELSNKPVSTQQEIKDAISNYDSHFEKEIKYTERKR